MSSRSPNLTSLSIRDASKRYGRSYALAKVTLEIQRGEPCVIMGNNGAGKSTLLEVLAQIRGLDEGQVVYRSSDAVLTPAAVRGQIGLITAQPLIYEDLSALENVVLFARVGGVSNPLDVSRRTLESMGIDPTSPKPAAQLSRGMRARLGAARALAPLPRLLILDEATAALDRSGRIALVDRILARAGESVIVMATHHLDVAARVARRLVMLRGGRLVYNRLLEAPDAGGRSRQISSALESL